MHGTENKWRPHNYRCVSCVLGTGAPHRGGLARVSIGLCRGRVRDAARHAPSATGALRDHSHLAEPNRRGAARGVAWRAGPCRATGGAQLRCRPATVGALRVFFRSHEARASAHPHPAAPRPTGSRGARPLLRCGVAGGRAPLRESDGRAHAQPSPRRPRLWREVHAPAAARPRLAGPPSLSPPRPPPRAAHPRPPPLDDAARCLAWPPRRPGRAGPRRPPLWLPPPSWRCAARRRPAPRARRQQQWG